MNSDVLKLANIWANTRAENDGVISYTFSEKALGVFAEEIAKVCADIILTWESEPFPLDPKYGAKMIKEHFGIDK